MGLYFESGVIALPQRLVAREPTIAALFPDSDIKYHVTMLAENDLARTWLDKVLLRYLSRRGYAVTGSWHLMGYWETQAEADAVRDFILSEQPNALVSVFPLREGEMLPFTKVRPRSLKPDGNASQYKVVSISDLEKLIHALH